jgi:transposase
MGIMNTFSLTPAQKSALQQAIRHSDSSDVVIRAQALLWLASGKSPTEVASTLKVSRQTVYNWMSRVQDKRPGKLEGALIDTPKPGRPASMLEKVIPILEEVVDFDPREFGFHQTTWTAPLLQFYLHSQHSVNVSADTVHRALSELHLKWKRPRYVLTLKDPHASQSKGG